jgi:hypothetical protein
MGKKNAFPSLPRTRDKRLFMPQSMVLVIAVPP